MGEFAKDLSDQVRIRIVSDGFEDFHHSLGSFHRFHPNHCTRL